MSEIRVGDKVNISAEVISISGNLYNDKAELRFKNGYKIKVPISAINNEDEENIIKDFALQASDIHFTYRKDWASVDNHCLRTVSGAIYDKEVCLHLYEDLSKFPINSYGRIDLNGIYDHVMLSYLFNLPEDETDNFKDYMLDKNSFLRIYPIYKDYCEGIHIGKYESICATTEVIWNKYRFKDALEVYDKMNKTDWASKFDIPNIKGE